MGQLTSILQKVSTPESPHADGEGLNAQHNISKLAYAAVLLLYSFYLRTFIVMLQLAGKL